eukprot:3720983-Rhodomonas_salina.1
MSAEAEGEEKEDEEADTAGMGNQLVEQEADEKLEEFWDEEEQRKVSVEEKSLPFEASTSSISFEETTSVFEETARQQAKGLAAHQQRRRGRKRVRGGARIGRHHDRGGCSCTGSSRPSPSVRSHAPGVAGKPGWAVEDPG